MMVHDECWSISGIVGKPTTQFMLRPWAFICYRSGELEDESLSSSTGQSSSSERRSGKMCATEIQYFVGLTRLGLKFASKQNLAYGELTLKGDRESLDGIPKTMWIENAKWKTIRGVHWRNQRWKLGTF